MIWPFGNQTRIQLARIIVVIALLGVWQFGSGRFLDPFYFSAPFAIARKLVDEFQTVSFYQDLWVTFFEMAAGYVSGAVCGVLLGVLLARWQMVAEVLDPILIALNSIPRIAIAPILVVWLGIDLAPKIVLAATLVFFLIFFNTLSGIRSVETGYVDVARIQGATDWQIFRKVMLPAASSWILTGLRTSLPFALIGVIVGEFMVASSGLGFRLNFFSTSYNTTGTFAMLFVMMALMMLLNATANIAERLILKWRPRNAFELDANHL